MQKLASKLYRLKFSKEIRSFVEALSITNLSEIQSGNFVYAGDGTVNTGMSTFPTSVRIIRTKHGMDAVIRSDKAGVSIELPFNRKDQMEAATEAAPSIKTSFLN